MNLGQVFKWTTVKVQGREIRNKFHVFICASDDEGENTFLFINSNDWFGDYKLVKSDDYPFLEYDSYVGCSSAISYTDAELTLFDQTPVGQLTKDDLKKLRDALIAAETMETRDLNRVCKALIPAL